MRPERLSVISLKVAPFTTGGIMICRACRTGKCDCIPPLSYPHLGAYPDFWPPRDGERGGGNFQGDCFFEGEARRTARPFFRLVKRSKVAILLFDLDQI
jgi:hypothetical protein